MRDLSRFIARCRAAFPDFVTARYNDVIGRYEIVTRSTVGREVSQFLGWWTNPLTGARIEPDPVTGLVPFRELDEDAQEEVFRSMQVTGIDNRHDGPGSHAKKMAQARAYNAALEKTRRRARAETIADLFKEVDLRRPWVKDHPHAKDPRGARLRRKIA